jgi:hypothetical protein
VAARSGVGLRPLACWKCGFEFRRGYGCLSLVCVECDQVEVSASGLSPIQRSYTKYGGSEFDRKTSTKRRPWPTKGLSRQGQTNDGFINILTRHKAVEFISYLIILTCICLRSSYFRMTLVTAHFVTSHRGCGG